MLIYFLCLLYWLLLYAFRRGETTNTGLFFAILPLFLVMALKSVSVGSDTISYYARYVNAETMLEASRTITEPGYNLVSYFFHDVLRVPFYVYYALMSLFICYNLALFIKYYSSNVYLSLFVYMTIGLFTMSMSGLRQMLAISICFIPLIVARKEEGRKNRKRRGRFYLIGLGVICSLIAYTFHNSALVFLPVVFLFDIRLTKIETIAILLIAISTILFRSILVNVLDVLAPDKYEQYDFQEGYNMNILILLLPIVIGLFCTFVSNPEKSRSTYSKEMSLMFIFFALFVVFNNLALSHNQIARIGYYFSNATIILIPHAIHQLPRDTRRLATVPIILLCLIFFYLGTDGGTLKIDRYLFFWQEPVYMMYQ